MMRKQSIGIYVRNVGLMFVLFDILGAGHKGLIERRRIRMFNIGDKIIYGNSGVCEVRDITTMDVNHAGGEKLYYILKPLFQTFTVYTPVDNDKVLMRPIISRSEAERLIHKIPTMRLDVYHSKSLGELTGHYESIINTLDGEELIRLTMSVYTKNQMRTDQKLKPGAIDQRYMKRAEDLLFGEFAVALGIEKADVQNYIATNAYCEQTGN
jgi:CarD family transcriptional regulator